MYRYRHVSRLPQPFVDGGSVFRLLMITAVTSTVNTAVMNAGCTRLLRLQFFAIYALGFPGATSGGQEPAVTAGEGREASGVPGWGRAAGIGNPLLHSCLGNPADRGTQQSTEAGRAGRDCSTVFGALHAGPPAAPGDRPTQEAASLGLFLISPASSLRP